MKPAVAALGLAALCAAIPASAADDTYVHIAGNPVFRSVLPGSPAGVPVHGYWLRRLPVTNAEFRAFLARHPEWRKDRVPHLFAGADYLGHWQAAQSYTDPVRDRQPVTRVSWFAANAFCADEGARLPSWHEWELAAAADATRADARSDPQWRQRILDWYARPASAGLPDVGTQPPDVHGVQDLHGLVWEWVGDSGSLVVDEQARGELQQVCGGGAAELQQKENYAVLMRVAMLSSLQGSDNGRTLGFRCARDEPGVSP